MGPLWPLNFGQIYQTLKDLRRRGLIEGRFDRGTGHVGRWVYTITAKGRRALETWLHRMPRQPQAPRDEMLIRLLVLDQHDVSLRLAQISAQEQVYREYIANLTAQRKTLEQSPKAVLLKAVAIDAAVFHAQAQMRWLSRCTKLLKRHCSGDAVRAPSGREKRVATPKVQTVARV